MLISGTHLVWSHVVLVLLYSINSGFASPVQNVLEKREVAHSTLKMKMKEAYELVLDFFRPVTCRQKDERTLVPCHAGEGLNTTECLANKCCPSSHELNCYMPFKDNMQLAFRLIVLVAGGFFFLGCLPFCCCACLQRSHCINPLRRANNEVKKIEQKRKRAQNEDVHIPLLS